MMTRPNGYRFTKLTLLYLIKPNPLHNTQATQPTLCPPAPSKICQIELPNRRTSFLILKGITDIRGGGWVNINCRFPPIF